MQTRQKSDFPLVSIIIPCYNHEGYIEETLNSILADTYPQKEIVIINDGSTDNSNARITRWIAEHGMDVDVIYLNRENKGLCNTLNELVEKSNGKYIIVLASDDLLVGNTIARRVQLLETSPEKLVVLSDAAVIDEQGQVIHQSCLEGFFRRKKEVYRNDDTLIRELISNFSIAGAVSMYDRRIFEVIGTYPADGQAEDWFFYQRAACRKKIVFWDEIVSYYRIHGANHFQNVSTQLPIFKSIVSSIRENLLWYPGLKNKPLGVYQLAKFYYAFTRLLLKK